MRPYALAVSGKGFECVAQVVSLIGVVGTSCFGAVAFRPAEEQASVQKRLSPAVYHAVKTEALMRSWFAHF